MSHAPAIFMGAKAHHAPPNVLRANPRGVPRAYQEELAARTATMETMVARVISAQLQRGGEIHANEQVASAELAEHERRQRVFAERLSQLRIEDAELTQTLHRERLERAAVDYAELFQPQGPLLSIPVHEASPVTAPEDEKKEPPESTASSEPSADISVEIPKPALRRAPRRVVRVARPTATSLARAQAVARGKPKSK